MTESPPSLEDTVIDYISSNLLCVCHVNLNIFPPKLQFKNPDAFFPQKLADKLFISLGRNGTLNDLNLSLFRPDVLQLSFVNIHEGKFLSKEGLQMLKNYKLSSITIQYLYNASINELIGCFSDWTLNNIVSLNIGGSTLCSRSLDSSHDNVSQENSKELNVFYWQHLTNLFNQSLPGSVEDLTNVSRGKVFKNLPRMYVSLCQLKSLQVLNISGTEITSHILINLCENLKHLKSLDISLCNRLESIEALVCLKDTLKSLSLHNLKLINQKETLAVLKTLKQLVFLDVSQSKHFDIILHFSPESIETSDLFECFAELPRLQSLDVSGHENLSILDIRLFLERHVNVKFLGLMFTPVSSDLSTFTHIHVPTVTGDAQLSHLLEALERYACRKEFISQILFKIFKITSDFAAPQPEIVKAVVAVLNRYRLELPIQLAGTACLYNLTKAPMGEKIHPNVLQSVVKSTLTAMNNFPGHNQLQKNALLTLCCDRIVHEVSFDKYWCAKLVLECLTLNDYTIDRMAVAICSILAAKISTSQTALLGASSIHMKNLLKLVDQKTKEKVVDITLKFTLSTLWNLTDESPATCEVFLAENGLDLFMNVLKVFIHDAAVETKVLGVLNNIAEVSPLRSCLINDQLLNHLSFLLNSDHVDVCYFSAGIISHLSCADQDAWNQCTIKQQDLLQELNCSILTWKQPKKEMVAYRSFEPFVPLLLCHEKPPVQLWAVWALHHVSTRNSKRYCRMLVEEGVDELLHRLSNPTHGDTDIRHFASDIVKLLEENNFHRKNQVR